MSGYGWYRFTVQVPAGTRPTSLLLAPIVTAYEVYVDGRKVGVSGNMSPDAVPSTRFSFALFPLTASGSPTLRNVLVAIRVWHSPIWAGYMGGGPFQAGHLVGDPALLASEQEHHQISRNLLFVDEYAYSIASGLIGIVIFCLFLIRPTEREYLWFAAMLLAQALDCVLVIAHEVWAVPPVPVFDLLDATLNGIVIIANFCFVTRVLKKRFLALGKVLVVMAAVSPLMAVLYWPGWASSAASAALQLIFLLPLIIWPIYLLVRAAIKGNLDARLLLLPILLASGYYAIDNLVLLLSQAGWVRRPQWMDLPLPLPPFTEHIQIVLNLFFLLAMLGFLIRRFTLARRREERLVSEFEAARQVQQLLLPDQMDQCPGFAVDWIYQPADQVGGDFFQQLCDDKGGILLVVGDVSGKGLPAAMIVSVLVGAIRAEAAHNTDPAAMLTSLNRRMMGRSHGGFVTCMAAHFAADGTLTIANAGHLPPYLNGVELAINGSLPLGILASETYECRAIPLRSGDRLMFVSDGVVEAQSRSGALFGFDRTREMSNGPAQVIAAAAQRFGQSDDITVVTVEFSSVNATVEPVYVA
jgi:hypothetical protein